MPRNLSEFQAHQDLAAGASTIMAAKLAQDAERARWAQVLAPHQSPRASDLEPVRAALADALATQGAWA